ncbi:CpaF family protein [Candidatus Micrarchaeota archaeon]|nr:CpaF family protein [Candidatus Micrarchaeota archaeon]
MLGWHVRGSAQYDLRLPPLSEDEEKLICQIEEAAKKESRDKDPSMREQIISDLIRSSAQQSSVYLDQSQKEYLHSYALSHIFGNAFIDFLLEDPSIEEISIIGPNKPAYVYLRDLGWQQTNAQFETLQMITDVVNKLGRNLGRHITLQNPRLDAVLSDGSRLHASLPPLSSGEITIRKFRDRPFSPRELVDHELCDFETLALLSLIMQCDCSLLIAGNTASGKTTTLNSLFSFVPKSERILIIEETPEVNLPHEHLLRLVSNKQMGIGLTDLVYDSLRMRPDRMVVGEIRSSLEATALMEVLLAGQARGSYATMHAKSAKEAILRLGGFGVLEQDLEAIDAILVQRRLMIYDSSSKKLTEIRRIVELSEFHSSKVHPLIQNGVLSSDSRIVQKLLDSLKISKSELDEQLTKRIQFLKAAPLDYRSFFDSYQQEFFDFVPSIREDDDE